MPPDFESRMGEGYPTIEALRAGGWLPVRRLIWATQATVRWARRWATRGPMRLEGRTHPGVRATGTAIGALFLNLFGLAADMARANEAPSQPLAGLSAPAPA